MTKPSSAVQKVGAFAGWVLTSLAVAVLYLGVARPDLQGWRGTDTHGDPTRRQVALTFDDGPDPLWAPLLADTLARHGAHGTFFVVGNRAQLYPELTVRLLRDGHELGNHSMTHPAPNLTAFPAARVTNEICGAADYLEKLTGQPVRYFRPPGGGVDNTMITILRREKMRMGGWSLNSGDYSSPPPPVIVNRLREHLRPGLVVLLHQREQTVAAMERFLADEAGTYSYVTYSTLMRQ